MGATRLGLVLALTMLCRTGMAQPRAIATEARAEYDAGAVAYEAKDFRRAAALFTHADELAPNPMVLKLALAAATRADDAVLGMTLVLRAEARAVDGSLAEVARHARSRFAGRVGMIRIVCATRDRCHARAEGRRAGDGELLVVAPGEVEAVFEEASASTRARVAARAVVDIMEPARAEPAPPAVPVPAPAPAVEAHSPGVALPPERTKPLESAGGESPSGLSPAFFWGGVVLSGALGVATVASGLDTVAQHDDFAEDRTIGARDRGMAAESRTNVLLVSSLVAAAATGVIGVFFTRWRTDATSRTSPHAGTATIRF